jgi:hypothetical protein
VNGTPTWDGGPDAEFDPYRLTYSGQEAAPELVAARRYLAQGNWVTGAALVQEMGKAIPDGVALRFAQDNLKNAPGYTRAELIDRGKRRLAAVAIRGQLVRGSLVTDPSVLRKAHYALREPWKIRDLYPGAMSIRAAALIIGTTEYNLVTWIRRGDVPMPPRHDGRGPYLITPPVLAVLKRVAPYWSGTRWKVDPRSLWSDEPDGPACPHCGGRLIIETSVGKPYVAPAPPEETPPVPSQPDDEISDEV